MACQNGQTAVNGLEKIDSALDALVKYIKKQPTTERINVLSSKVKNEIQREKERAENRKLEIRQLQENKRKYEEQIENYTKLYSKDRHDMELNHIHDKEAESKTKIISLNLKIQYLEKEKDSRDRKIEHLQEKLQGKYILVDIERRDLKIKDLEKRLDIIRTEMTCEKELFIKKMEKQEKQLSKQRGELQQASNQLYETDQSRIINSLKKDNLEKDHHISELSEQLKQSMKVEEDKNVQMLNRKVVEISQLNERNEFLKQKMKEKDSQLHKLRTELSCENERLEQKLTAKNKQFSLINAQLEEASNQLLRTKSYLTSLKNANACLLAKVKRRDLKINNLEEILESTITEIKDEKDRISKETEQEKDAQISKLRDQQ